MPRYALLLAIILLIPSSAFAQDRDGDGILDIDEDKNQNNIVDPWETDPWNADTDSGGEADGAEVLRGSNPLEQTDDVTYDRDGDGLTNGEEAELGSDPDNPDSDGDGIRDGNDPFPIDAEYAKDADSDGVPDEFEILHGLSPTDPSDGAADTDGDGLDNRNEFIEGTDPIEPDTDRDGAVDGAEVRDGTDPEESPCLLYAQPTQPLSDTQGHWSETFVTRLQRTKILPESNRMVRGYQDGDQWLFRPDQQISRFELLKLAILSSCIHLTKDYDKVALEFSDVPSAPRPHEPEDREQWRRIIYTAVRYNIIQGYQDGTFKPDQPVNRAEALKILLTASRIPTIYEEGILPFSDVPPNAWYQQYVKQALLYGLVDGYSDGTFRPDQPITRAEAAKIVFLLMLVNPGVNGYELPAEGIRLPEDHTELLPKNHDDPILIDPITGTGTLENPEHDPALLPET